MAIKKVTLSMKHNDLVYMTLDDEKNVEIFEHDGYMPDMGALGGDTTEFVIDNETGKILGWTPITEQDLKNFKDENDDVDAEDDVEDDED